MPNTTSIIRTKLHPPFIRQRIIPRPRLEARIAKGLRGPLTLVTAPAGFGKTTLTAACIAAAGMPTAWLSLDRGDNPVERFLAYLAAALQEVGAAPGIDPAQLLSAESQAPPEAVLTGIINGLAASGTETALVLDDYQFISSQDVHTAVIFLLDHCPQTLHLLIASRSDPPLPLMRLRARAQVVEVRAADLRFTEPEAAQFLNDVMDLRLDAEAVAALEARTEGWITGLQMAALSMRDRADAAAFIDGFSGTNRYILDYLLEEVLASQPRETQRFLLSTSLLRRLTAPLCDALLADEVGKSAAIIAELERANLFLVPLDDERVWYRYHHLFADMLRARLLQASPEAVPGLHVRAATWLEGQDLIIEAIDHLFAAGAPDKAAELIERYGPSRLADDDPSVLQMAERLPPDLLLARPRIGLHRCWLLIVRGQIDQALPLLHDLDAHLSAWEPGPDGPWMRTWITCAQAFLNPRVDPLPGYDMVEDIPAGEPVLRTTADIIYGMTLGRIGEMEQAAQVAEACLQREPARPGSIPMLATFLSRIYLMLGRLHAATSLCHRYLDPLSGRSRVYSAGSLLIDLGEVLYEWNRLEEAGRYIRNGLQDIELLHNIMTEGFGLVALARLQMARGDFAGAMETVEAFETGMRDGSMPAEFREDFYTLRVRVQLAGGDLNSAARWADDVQRSPDFEPQRDYYRLTLARIRLAQGRYHEVEDLLDGVSLPDPVGSLVGRRIEANLLRAVALSGLQRLPGAMALVGASLALAEPDGHIRAFLDAGDAARDLLAAYLRAGDPGQAAFARQVFDAFPQPTGFSEPGTPAGGLVEPLSERELEVLQLIARGMTNKQIAGELIISPGTVKAHTSAIYRKLDVANRTEAVTQARELGIRV